MVSLGAQEKKF